MTLESLCSPYPPVYNSTVCLLLPTLHSSTQALSGSCSNDFLLVLMDCSPALAPMNPETVLYLLNQVSPWGSDCHLWEKKKKVFTPFSYSLFYNFQFITELRGEGTQQQKQPQYMVNKIVGNKHLNYHIQKIYIHKVKNWSVFSSCLWPQCVPIVIRWS